MAKEAKEAKGLTALKKIRERRDANYQRLQFCKQHQFRAEIHLCSEIETMLRQLERDMEGIFGLDQIPLVN